MEDVSIVTEQSSRKISVTFERKLDLGDYQNVTARVWVEDEIDGSLSDADVSGRAVDLLNVAKSAVLDTLGIEAFLDDSGVIREKHSPTPTVRGAADKVGTQMPGTTVQSSGIRVMNEKDLKEPVPGWVVDKCNEKGITAVWVNYGKYGAFFKEAVKQGESPLIPDPNNPTRPGIIKQDS